MNNIWCSSYDFNKAPSKPWEWDFLIILLGLEYKLYLNHICMSEMTGWKDAYINFVVACLKFRQDRLCNDG